MSRGARVAASLGIASLVLTAAIAVFALQYAQASAQCSAVPGGDCSAMSSAQMAVDGLFVAAAGLLAAIVLAMTAGINWRTSPTANTALALRLSAEEEAFERERARRAQLAELNQLALSHAVGQAQAEAERQAAAEAAAAAVKRDAEEAALAAGQTPAGWQEEEAPVDTAELARRRATAERLRAIARSHPETVAAVLQNWINQRR